MFWSGTTLSMFTLCRAPNPLQLWHMPLGELKEKFDLAKTNPLKRVGDHQELANLAAYLVSDFSSYVNGEVITVDGGEWIKGAGQFNQLEEVPQQMWDMLEAMIRSKKNKS